MNKKISIERSLFYIQQQHIEKFNWLAEKMAKFNSIINGGGITRDDAWIVAFNIWALLLPDKYKIIESVDKTLYYSTNFLLLNTIRQHSHFQKIKKHPKTTDELKYLTSLFIANGTNKWALELMEKYMILDIAEKNKKRCFFDSHKGSEEEIQAFLREQSRLVKAVVKELSTTNSFEQLIKKCCDDAYSLYKENFINQPKHT